MTALAILYVDDDPDIRAIVAMALTLDPTITLRVAASGDEALAVVAGGFIPDVAILDVMMPGMSGPELLERLHGQETTARLPVIFMTARARQGDVAQYLARGAIGVILKPFDPIGLAQEIRTRLAAHDNHAP